MRYALLCLIRFDDREQRDKFYEALKPFVKQQFKDDDCFLSRHTCRHDEDPRTPCTEVENWPPALYSLSEAPTLIP